VREQALVGGLPQREVEPHLVGRHLESGAERCDVGGQQRRAAGRSERQADVGGADHLDGKPADRLADLRAEHRAAHARHHLLQRAARSGQRLQLLR
jgi:hypothetical protein